MLFFHHFAFLTGARDTSVVDAGKKEASLAGPTLLNNKRWPPNIRPPHTHTRQLLIHIPRSSRTETENLNQSNIIIITTLLRLSTPHPLESIPRTRNSHSISNASRTTHIYYIHTLPTNKFAYPNTTTNTTNTRTNSHAFPR